MKTKAKLILAMSVLTAGVVAAGATGTFAWFTTNRAAQLHYNTVTAQKNAGNLEVSLGGSSDKSTFSKGSPATTGKDQPIASASINSTSKVSDVSSCNGYDFCKPIWKTVSGNNQAATMFKTGEWGVDYTTFWFSVSNTGRSALDVYLNKATAIAPADNGKTADKAAATFTRVSIARTEEKAGGIPKTLEAAPSENWLLENNSSDASNQKYFKPADYNQPQTVVPVALPSGEEAPKIHSFVLDSGSATTAMEEVTVTGTSDQLLCTLPAKTDETNPTFYFAVSVWLEGVKESSTYSFDGAVGGQVNITLDLAGVEHVGA